MWQVLASVHHQTSRYETKQIRLPPFIVNYAEDENHLREQVNKIVNPTNNPAIVVIVKASRKVNQ